MLIDWLSIWKYFEIGKYEIKVISLKKRITDDMTIIVTKTL